VLADQFEKRGVAHAATRKKAIVIVDRGDDLDMMEKRGMKQPDLRKRGASLAELRTRLAAAPRTSTPARPLRRRKPYVLEIGVLYACPVRGDNINPRGGKKNFDGSPWISDGWRQFVILNRGRAFDYFAWYQPLVCKEDDVGEARRRRCWRRPLVGTRHASHMSTTPFRGSGNRRCRHVADRHGKSADSISEDPAGYRLPRLGRPQRCGEWHHNFRNNVPIEPRLAEMVRTKGLLPEEGPTTMRSLQELLAEGLGPRS
jgi:hypothetical protein